MKKKIVNTIRIWRFFFRPLAKFTAFLEAPFFRGRTLSRFREVGRSGYLRGLDRLKETKILFKYGEQRSIGCDCTYEEKTIFLGFTQNGCYGNQPHPFEALI